VEPSQTATLIYEDLTLYKQGYEILTQSIRKDKYLINEKNILIENLKNELDRYKEKYRLTMSNVKKQPSLDTNSIFKVAKKFFDKKEAEKHTSAEWLKLLNTLDIRLNDIEKLSNNEVFGKVIQILDQLHHVVVGKNIQLGVLIKDNEKLNHKNAKLKSNKVKQNKTIIELKQKINQLTQEFEQNHLNTSMNNNISNIEDSKDKYKYNTNHVQNIQNINEYRKTVIK
jgi:hypothetical protein